MKCIYRYMYADGNAMINKKIRIENFEIIVE